MKSLLALALFVCGPAAAQEFCVARAWPQPISTQRVLLKNCASIIRYSEKSAAYMGEARDYHKGFVEQFLSDGEDCGDSDVIVIIQDCATIKAAIFGEPLDKDDTVSSAIALENEVYAAIRDGKPLSVDEILTRARGANFPIAVESTTTSSLNINGRRFQLGCGCQKYYPNGVAADG